MSLSLQPVPPHRWDCTIEQRKERTPSKGGEVCFAHTYSAYRFSSAVWCYYTPLASSDVGPQIVVLSPHEGDTVIAPFDLDVRFLASADAHIAPDTLKVEVKKMLWGVDVTEHVKQLADAAGIRMTQADFPKGHHTVTLQIADEGGRVSAKTVTMDVQ
jgi:hypothetical protein